MAPVFISTAMFPVSGHTPVGTIFFYGSREDVESFFKSENCTEQNQLIQKHNVKYVLSDEVMDCDWEEVYGDGENWIYRV